MKIQDRYLYFSNSSSGVFETQALTSMRLSLRTTFTPEVINSSFTSLTSFQVIDHPFSVSKLTILQQCLGVFVLCCL